MYNENVSFDKIQDILIRCINCESSKEVEDIAENYLMNSEFIKNFFTCHKYTYCEIINFFDNQMNNKYLMNIDIAYDIIDYWEETLIESFYKDKYYILYDKILKYYNYNVQYDFMFNDIEIFAKHTAFNNDYEYKIKDENDEKTLLYYCLDTLGSADINKLELIYPLLRYQSSYELLKNHINIEWQGILNNETIYKEYLQPLILEKKCIDPLNLLEVCYNVYSLEDESILIDMIIDNVMNDDTNETIDDIISQFEDLKNYIKYSENECMIDNQIMYSKVKEA